MTLKHLQDEIAYLERLRVSIGLTEHSKIKLLFFNEAMLLINKEGGD